MMQNVNCASPFEILDVTADYLINKIDKFSSKFKRDKIIHRLPNYVELVSKHISTYWDNLPSSSVVVRKESNFEYVSIIKTLKSVFSFKEYRDMYFKYNESHICAEGMYSEICCCKNDFEPADALKSKASIYKTEGIYLSVRNIPISLRSKLKNIYLVALVYSNDMKSSREANDIVWKTISNEINILQTKGIRAGLQIIKGTLINVTCDNLGANQCLGFSEGFSARFYCRICQLPKKNARKCVVKIKTPYAIYKTIMNISKWRKNTSIRMRKSICKRLVV